MIWGKFDDERRIQDKKAYTLLRKTLYADNPDECPDYLCVEIDDQSKCDYPKEYSVDLKIFKTLFASDDPDIRTALWNAVNTCAGTDLTPSDDLSDEEYAFLKLRYEAKAGIRYNSNINPPIATERLVLRPICEDDQKLFSYHYMHDGDFYICAGEEPTAENIENSAERFGNLYFTVENRKTGEVIGNLGMKLHEKTPTAELEYYIFKEHRRNGYCREAVLALAEKAFRGELAVPEYTVRDDVYERKNVRIDVIRAMVPEINEPSLNTVRSCGFIHEGTLHRAFAAGNNYYVNEEVFYKTGD